MELIIEIGSRREKNGKLVKWGKFLCVNCGIIIEKRLCNGLKAKSCGCDWHNFTDEHKNNISISLKGKKKSEQHKQKVSEIRIEKGVAKGENNPNYGNKLSEESKNKIAEKNRNNSYRKGKKHTEEAKQKISKTRIEREVAKGENNPAWDGGKSFEEYPQEFYVIRESILERDNYTCQCLNCEHKTNILDVHHIDFNKNNNVQNNLIILCHSCHAKTFNKNNRNYWINFYQNIMKVRGF